VHEKLIVTQGYLGGSVLSRFLKHPNAGSFNITALVRSPEKAEKLKAFGVNPVVGSLSDTLLLEKLTVQADVVIEMVGSTFSKHGSTEKKSLSREG
jgi:uncharacterized protein YbjT (DUF2867 family)